MADIRKDPSIVNLLERMPDSISSTFDDEQLTYLKVAIGARQWGNHSVDCRGVIKFFRYRYYVVFLAGRNRRALSDKEKIFSALTQACFISLITFFIIILFLLTIYLFKSALGIDIFEGYSFGIWSWFKNLF